MFLKMVLDLRNEGKLNISIPCDGKLWPQWTHLKAGEGVPQGSFSALFYSQFL